MAARCFGASAWIGCPMNTYSPAQAASCMPRMWSSVDLPAPEGPMIDTNSPGLMSTVIRRSTYVWPGPTGYDFSIPRVEMIGVFAGRSVALGTADNEDVRLNSMELLFAPEGQPRAAAALERCTMYSRETVYGVHRPRAVVGSAR